MGAQDRAQVLKSGLNSYEFSYLAGCTSGGGGEGDSSDVLVGHWVPDFRRRFYVVRTGVTVLTLDKRISGCRVGSVASQIGGRYDSSPTDGRRFLATACCPVRPPVLPLVEL